ncbi:hypothetical protein [Dyadobacter bucti]|uniref:hypothetical protein n=1 Tax=Dyadobacter bucti TaxID=2572203 RepID=UPI003F72C076
MGRIIVQEEQHPDRCIAFGGNTGLFKGERVSKGCTPNYLPELIAIESNKRNLCLESFNDQKSQTDHDQSETLLKINLQANTSCRFEQSELLSFSELQCDA